MSGWMDLFGERLVVPVDDAASRLLYVKTKTRALYGDAAESDAYQEEDEDEEIGSNTQVNETNQNNQNNQNNNNRNNNHTDKYHTNKTNENETSQAVVVAQHTEYENVPSDWKLLRVIADAHQGWVRSVDIDVSNNWFASGGSDASIKVWDLASLRIKATISGHIMAVRALKVSARFPYLFSGSEDKTVRCWDLERSNSPEGCQIRDYHGHVGGIYALDLHPELDLLVTGGRDAAIRVWDIRSRTQVMLLAGHRGDVTGVSCSANDPQVVSSSMDGTLRLWDLRNATTQLCITQHSKSIRLMAVHPKEATLCSADTAGRFKQWVLPRGDLLNEWTTATTADSTIVNTLAINPVDNTLFAGYDNGKMEFYDYVSGELRMATKSTPVPGLAGASSAIYASQFDKLGSRLICCEGDKSIKVWGVS